MTEKIEFFLDLYIHEKVEYTGDLIFIETESSNFPHRIAFSNLRNPNFKDRKNVFYLKTSIAFLFSSYILFGEIKTHYKKINVREN